MGILALLLVIAALSSPQTDCKPQFAPLETGSSYGDSTLEFWRKEEAGDWGGTGWLGWELKSSPLTLLLTDQAGQLETVELVVRDHPKSFPDDDERVSVQSVPDVTFAVRCVPQLKPGPIRTLNLVNHDLNHTGPLVVSLGDHRYEVKLQSTREDRSDARVLLTDGRATQVLYDAEGFTDDPHYEIKWAGDLDHDGRLDLVVNLHRKYSWHPYRLLLSSHAAPGQLVADAALFETGD